MKTLKLAVVLASMCVLALVVTSVGPVSTVASANNGATVLQDLGCGIGIGGLFAVGTAQCVITSSGNESCKCTGDLVAGGPPDKAARFDGFGCGTPAGFTTDTHAVFTPSGNMSFECVIH